MNKADIESKLLELYEADKKNERAAGSLISAVRRKMFKNYGFICLNCSFHSKKEAEDLIRICDEVGIYEFYIDGEWSNQLEAWNSFVESGFELRGISKLKNADYYSEMAMYKESDLPEEILALHFER